MNSYELIVEPDGTQIEAWAGGPCITTGQFCPVWQVRKTNGTGRQSRGMSSGPDVKEHPELRHSAKKQALKAGLELAREYLNKEKNG